MIHSSVKNSAELSLFLWQGCFSPLWIAFSILIGGLLLDVLISISLGVSALPVNIIIGITIHFLCDCVVESRQSFGHTKPRSTNYLMRVYFCGRWYHVSCRCSCCVGSGNCSPACAGMLPWVESEERSPQGRPRYNSRVPSYCVNTKIKIECSYFICFHRYFKMLSSNDHWILPL